MPRRRRRRRLKPAPILFLLLLANVAVGLSFSPLTSVTKARVIGAEPFDRPRLERLLESLSDRPSARIDPRAVETEALKIPEALDSDFRRNILGRAQLKMAYRKPVAKIDGLPSTLMDENGVIYASRQPTRNLPRVRLPAKALEPQLAFVNSWPALPLAECCKRISKRIPKNDCVFELSLRGELCLNIKDSARIVFGSATQLDQKLSQLDALLNRNLRLTEIKELNLTAPSHPVYVPKVQEPSP
jgi:hypothetical protein